MRPAKPRRAPMAGRTGFTGTPVIGMVKPMSILNQTTTTMTKKTTLRGGLLVMRAV
ncbi:hypothetical protein [Niveispirillum sp. KHB5.9]|uniref:hypothetical protein n=1 Tax=Niveispirillum sp. KHB5.9 TaxID=3400269 RepID=UPI003A893575